MRQAMNLDDIASTSAVVTIDDDVANDNGYLAGLRSYYQSSMANQDDNSACQNLAGGLKAAQTTGLTAIIGGHGNSGLINTGGGQTWPAGNLDRTIAERGDVDSTSIWQPLVQDFSNRYARVVLMGCNVGADQEGVDLLSDLAGLVGAPVLGSTGEIFIKNGVPTPEPGSVWQTAYPGQPKPSPIPPPTPPSSKWTHFTLIRDGIERVPLTTVRVARYRSLMPSRGSGDGEIELRNDSAHQFLQTIRFDEPMQWGPLGAIATGILRTAHDDANLRGEREFTVYNDLVVVDSKFPEVVYRGTAEFRNAIQRVDKRGSS